jgi:hypothetical protein
MKATRGHHKLGLLGLQLLLHLASLDSFQLRLCKLKVFLLRVAGDPRRAVDLGSPVFLEETADGKLCVQ